MQIDTHVHLLVSKSTRPDWDEIAFLFEVARQIGLDALCITEHRDADGYEELINGIFLDSKFACQYLEPGVIQLKNGLVLSSAAEVSLRGGGDIGIHTFPDALMKIPEGKGEISGIELFDLLADSNQVSVLHHSLIPGKWPVNIEEWNHAIDAIELPGKQLEKEYDYRSIATRWKKPIISGSDSHTWIQLGVSRTEILNSTYPYFSPKTLKNAITHSQTHVLSGVNSSTLINLSNLYRTRLDLKYRSSVSIY